MSGTSLDGVDIALVQFENNVPACLAFDTLPYPDSLKTQLHQINLSPNISLYAYSELHAQLGTFYAESVDTFLKARDIQPNAITAIGSHGQTIFHAPQHQMSVQIGHPAFIAKHTGITTVADFRVDDLANHGQGAPLAAAFHPLLFSQPEAAFAVVNIGGIANVTVFVNDAIVGFDTGPGNGLMDEVCQREFNQPYDQGGQRAADADFDPTLLAQLLDDPYFNAPFPKTTGREYFNHDWVNRYSHSLAPNALLATLNRLTAASIAGAIEPFALTRMIVTGGGAENATLLKNLNDLLPYPVSASTEFDVNPHSVEAMMMAWLAKQRLENQTVKLSQATGAKRDSVLGAIWHP